MNNKEFIDVSQSDIVEEAIKIFNASLLRRLLQDKTTKRNILWATKDYEALGPEYGELCEITPELITGDNTLLIQPRSSKDKKEQIARTKDKAEVFTPSWICNCQNNLVDSQWFGRQEVFNSEIPEGWITKKEPVDFTNTGKDWKQYVDAQRLEMTCGEAPYLVSRYDTVTGEFIPLHNRIGILDRKMRIVNENTHTETEWIEWTIRAFQSVYGFEYQGDNVLLARENLFLSFIDYYKDRNHKNPDIDQLRNIANIISWNIWQMDGRKYVVPNSCHDATIEQTDLVGVKIQKEPCPGCKYNKPFSHNGSYCIVQDWRSKKPVKFADMMKGWDLE